MPEETFFYLIVPSGSQDFLAIPAGRPGMLAAGSAAELVHKMDQELSHTFGSIAPAVPSWVRYDPSLHGPLTQILTA
jgi:hypothetical protein